MNKLYIGFVFIALFFLGYFLNFDKSINNENKKILKVENNIKTISKHIIKKDNDIIPKHIVKKDNDIIPKHIVKKDNEDIFYLKALKDLKDIHSGDNSSENILERKALLLAQILKVKQYYESHLDSFSDSEYEKVFSIIDKADTAYEDILYISLDCKDFASFFKEFNQIIVTL